MSLPFYVGHVICHVLPPLGYIVVEFIIAFHLTPLQFYEYVIYQSTWVHVYIQNTQLLFQHIVQWEIFTIFVVVVELRN